MNRVEYDRAMRRVRRFIRNDHRRGCDPYNSLFGHRHYGRIKR